MFSHRTWLSTYFIPSAASPGESLVSSEIYHSIENSITSQERWLDTGIINNRCWESTCSQEDPRATPIDFFPFHRAPTVLVLDYRYWDPSCCQREYFGERTLHLSGLFCIKCSYLYLQLLRPGIMPTIASRISFTPQRYHWHQVQIPSTTDLEPLHATKDSLKPVLYISAVCLAMCARTVSYRSRTIVCYQRESREYSRQPSGMPSTIC
jgi:hypothetical protein